jgi:hypothetical protein
MVWKPTRHYKARIGGIYFKNVLWPIEYNGLPQLAVSRNTENGLLGISCDIRDQNGVLVVQVENNHFNLRDSENYVCISGHNRSAVVDKKNGRVMCDVMSVVESQDFELEMSGLFFTADQYPIILHPNRSKFGKANDNLAPNISFLTLTTDGDSQANAIKVKNRGTLYLIGVAIENYRIGISIEGAKGQ